MEPAPILERPERRRPILVQLTVAAWVLLCVLVGGSLLIDHLVSLPTPAPADPAVRQAIADHRRPSQRGRWLALHVIADGCGCSRRVLDHLIADRRPDDLAERVVFVVDHPGDAAAGAAATIAEIRAAGFDLDVVGPDELGARYHVEAAPLLIVVGPDDDVRYLGGYTRRKQAATIYDLAIIDALRRGEVVEPLPAFGCAIGAALRSKLDPLGIRY